MEHGPEQERPGVRDYVATYATAARTRSRGVAGGLLGRVRAGVGGRRAGRPADARRS